MPPGNAASALAAAVIATSSQREGASRPGRHSACPRAISSRPTPRSATAVRRPGSACSTVRPWICRPRTTALRPPGAISTVSPTESRPRRSVPVTTVPKPAPREHPIDGEVGEAVVRTRAGLREQPRQRRRQRRDPRARERRGGDHRRGRDPGALGGGGELRRADLDRLGAREVGLGQRQHAAAHADQPGDLQVLHRLRLDPLVGVDGEQHGAHPRRARDHRAHEALVTGQVDEVDLAALAREQGEAWHDRDAAGALLLQPVGLDARERAHERSLAVIDMADHADEKSVQRSHRPDHLRRASVHAERTDP